MRTYPTNSSRAAGRLLALTMIVDGNVALSEMKTVYRSRILDHIALDEQEFDTVLHDLCHDLLATAHRGAVQIDVDLIDTLLDEIDAPALRRTLMQAMWKLADADGWLADAEAVLLNRAAIRWGAESNFVTAPAATVGAGARQA